MALSTIYCCVGAGDGGGLVGVGAAGRVHSGGGRADWTSLLLLYIVVWLQVMDVAWWVRVLLAASTVAAVVLTGLASYYYILLCGCR
jgi:hypothetical protein